jgi:hypothetical protein
MNVLPARRPILVHLSDQLAESGKWNVWRHADPRLAGHLSLAEALEVWRRDRAEASYLTVAALAGIGSSRGGDDDDAALAVAFLLQDGLVRIAVDVRDRCELDDVLAALWEEVKRSAPNMGPCAPRFLLRRTKARALGAGDGYMASRDVVSLQSLDTDRSQVHAQLVTRGSDEWSWHRLNGRPVGCADPDPVVEAATDLTDLLDWARARGVLAQDEVELVSELMATAHLIDGREAAYLAVGQRHGLALRTIRRRRDAVVRRLQAVAGDYLADVS